MEDAWGERILLGSLFWIFVPATVIFLIVAASEGAVSLGDWAFSSTGMAPGVITEVSFQPQHQEWHSNGKISWQATVPDTWFVNVAFNGHSGYLRVNHAPWSWERGGEAVDVEYRHWPISGEYTIDAIMVPK